MACEPLPKGPVWFLFFPHPVHVWNLPLTAPMWSPRDLLLNTFWGPQGHLAGATSFPTKTRGGGGVQNTFSWNHELLCGGSEITESEVLPLVRLWSGRGLHTHVHTHTHMHTPMHLFYSTAADTELTHPRIFLGETVQWSGNNIEAPLE